MLKPFKPICRGIRKNINSIFGEKIFEKYHGIVTINGEISNTSMYSDMVHKDTPMLQNGSNDDLIFNILNLLRKMGGLIQNGNRNKNSIINFNMNMTLEYYLDMLRFKNYQQYSLMNSLRSKLQNISNDEELNIYNTDIQNRLNAFKNNIFKINNLNGARYSKIDNSGRTIKLNCITSPFFYIMNNKSFKHLAGNNREFFNFISNIGEKSQTEKDISLKNRFIQSVYESSQDEAQFIWNLIQNGNIFSNETLNLVNSSNMSYQEDIAFILNSSSIENFREFLRLLKNNMYKYKNIKIDNYSKTLQNELRNVLSYNFVNSKKQFIDIFNNVTSQEKEKILKCLNIENDIIEYISNVSMQEYNQNINVLRNLNIDAFKDWLLNIDNLKIAMYYEVLEDKTIKSIFEKNLNTNFDWLVTKIFNSSNFTEYIKNNQHLEQNSFKTAFRDYIKSQVYSLQTKRQNNISQLLQKIKRKNFSFKELSKNEVSQLMEIVKSQTISIAKKRTFSEEEIEKILSILEDREEIVTNLVQKIDRKSFNLENLSQEESSQLMNILSSEMILTQNQSFSEEEIEKVISVLENRQEVVTNLVQKIDRKSFNLENLSQEESSQLMNILSSEMILTQNQSFSKEEIEKVISILENKQEVVTNLVQKIDRKSFNLENLSQEESSQLMDILSNEMILTQNQSFSEEEIEKVISILEDRQEVVTNLVQKIDRKSFNLENLSQEESSQLMNILSNEMILTQNRSFSEEEIEKVIFILENKQEVVTNLVQKIDRKSFNLENLSQEESSRLMDILSNEMILTQNRNFSEEEIEKVISILENKQEVVTNLVQKIDRKSFNLENLSQEESSQLMDILSNEMILTQNRNFSEEEVEKVISVLENRQEVVTNLVQKIDRKSFNLENLSQEESSQLMNILSNEMILTQNRNFSEEEVEKVISVLENRQEVVTNLVQKIDRKSFNLENLSQEESSQLMNILLNEMILTQNQSFSEEEIEKVVSILENRQEVMTNLVQKIDRKSFNLENLSQEESSQLMNILSSEMILSQNQSFSEEEIEKVISILENKQEVVTNLVQKIDRKSFNLENLSQEESSQLMDILSNEMILTQNRNFSEEEIEKVVSILEDRQEIVTNLVQKIDRKSFNLENLSQEESSQLMDILSNEMILTQNRNFSEEEIEKVVSILEDRQEIVTNLVQKIDRKSFNLENLSQEESSQLMDILSNEMILTQNRNFSEEEIEKVISVLENRQEVVTNLVQKIDRKSFNLENLSQEESSQLMNILSNEMILTQNRNFSEEEIEKVISVLENRQEVVTNLVQKIDRKSFNLENLSQEESSQLMDILSNEMILSQNRNFSEEEIEKVVSILEDRQEIVTNLVQKIDRKSFNLENLSQEESSQLMDILSNEMILTQNQSFSEEEIEKVVSILEDRQEIVTNLVQKIDRKSFNLENLSQEESSHLMDILSNEMILTQNRNFSEEEVEKVISILENKQEVVTNLVQKIDRKSFNLENLSKEESSHLMDILSNEMILTQNQSFSEEEVEKVISVLENRQEVVSNLVQKIDRKSFNLENLSQEESSQLMNILSNEMILTQNKNFSKEEIEKVISILEDRQEVVTNLVQKIDRKSFNLENLSQEESSQLMDILSNEMILTQNQSFSEEEIEKVIFILENKQEVVTNLVQKIDRKSFNLENLSQEESSHLMDILSNEMILTQNRNFSEEEVEKVISVLENRQEVVSNLVQKIDRKSFNLENLSQEESSQLIDILSNEMIFTKKSGQDELYSKVETFFKTTPLNFFTEDNNVTRLSKVVGNQLRNIDKTISTIRNISLVDTSNISRKVIDEVSYKAVKTLVVEDFPNYLREVPLNYYEVPTKVGVTIHNIANDYIEGNISHFQHKIEQSNNVNNVGENNEELHNLSRKVEEQSKKIENIEKNVSSNNVGYTLSQSDINNITNELINKLNNRLSAENIRRGIF